MRGEETEALGLFELPLAPRLEAGALVILPGTHSKHLVIADREIRDFQTFMTGELFEVVANHSILRYSVAAAGEAPAAVDRSRLDDFRSGVEHARRLPLAAALFRVRTRQLLERATPEANRAFLSGLLIGAELAYLAADADEDRAIVLAAAGMLGAVYREGLDALGLTSRTLVVPAADVERLSALGQVRCLRRISEER